MAPSIAARQQPNNLTYDGFIRMDQEEREHQFRDASPETKAMLKRTHAERWLAKHRKGLRESQIKLVEEGIAFITPELYRTPEDPQLRLKEEHLKKRLTCGLGQRQVTGAFTFWDQTARPSLMDTVDEWLNWFSKCQ
jgi:hypothetical protein